MTVLSGRVRRYRRKPYRSSSDRSRKSTATARVAGPVSGRVVRSRLRETSRESGGDPIRVARFRPGRRSALVLAVRLRAGSELRVVGTPDLSLSPYSLRSGPTRRPLRRTGADGSLADLARRDSLSTKAVPGVSGWGPGLMSSAPVAGLGSRFLAGSLSVSTSSIRARRRMSTPNRQISEISLGPFNTARSSEPGSRLPSPI